MRNEGNLEKKIYRLSWFQFAKKQIALIIVGSICTYSAFNDFNTPNESFPSWAIIILTIVSFISLLLLWEAINGRPNLCLSPEGLLFNYLRQKKLHKWDDVGPLWVSTSKVHYTKIISLNAYSENTHRAINQDESDYVYMPSDLDAEIHITISDLNIDRSEEGLHKLDTEVNRWRERHSKSKEKNVRYSEEKVKEITDKLDNKLNFWTRIFTVIGTIVIIYAAYQIISLLIIFTSNLVE